MDVTIQVCHGCATPQVPVFRLLRSFTSVIVCMHESSCAAIARCSDTPATARKALQAIEYSQGRAHTSRGALQHHQVIVFSPHAPCRALTLPAVCLGCRLRDTWRKDNEYAHGPFIVWCLARRQCCTRLKMGPQVIPGVYCRTRS